MDKYRELVEACRLLVKALDALSWTEANDQLADEIAVFLESKITLLENQQ